MSVQCKPELIRKAPPQECIREALGLSKDIIPDSSEVTFRDDGSVIVMDINGLLLSFIDKNGTVFHEDKILRDPVCGLPAKYGHVSNTQINAAKQFGDAPATMFGIPVKSR